MILYRVAVTCTHFSLRIDEKVRILDGPMQEHIKHAPNDASPSADILSASRGFSGPYTHIRWNHGVGKVLSNDWE